MSVCQGSTVGMVAGAAAFAAVVGLVLPGASSSPSGDAAEAYFGPLEPMPSPQEVGLVSPERPTPGGAPWTEDEHASISWAVDRLDSVGLRVPAVDIAFSDDRADCRWADGIFRSGESRATITVCLPDLGTAASDVWRRRTLVHELVHAWEYVSLDADDRTDLLALLEAEHWSGPDARWEDQGRERLAETVTWGLYDQRRRPVLIDAPCSALHADFVAIVGSEALGPLEPVCELDNNEKEATVGHA